MEAVCDLETLERRRDGAAESGGIERPVRCRACFILKVPGERRRSVEDELHVLPSSIKSAIVEPPRVTPRRRRRIRSAVARAASALNAPAGGARWATILPRRVDRHRLAGLDPIEQLTEPVLGLEGADFTHRRVRLACSLACSLACLTPSPLDAQRFSGNWRNLLGVRRAGPGARSVGSSARGLDSVDHARRQAKGASAAVDPDQHRSQRSR